MNVILTKQWASLLLDTVSANLFTFIYYSVCWAIFGVICANKMCKITAPKWAIQRNRWKFQKEKNLGSTSSIESIYLENRERLSIIMVVETRFHSMTFSDTFITLCIHLKFSTHNTLITATQDYLQLHIVNSCLTN